MATDILKEHNKHFILKISPQELTYMPMCNLSKIVHIVWLQQSRKRGAYLYDATSDDYV
jgi:hypothetical protein